MKRYFILIFLCLCPSGSFADISTGLVGWWKLNDGAGTSALDSSGNANTATLFNTPTWVTPSKIGNYALGLNGTTQYGESTTVVNIPANNATQTLSAWVKVAGAGTQDIVVPEKNGTAANQLRITGGNADVSQWGGTNTITGGAVSSNVWHMVTWTYNSVGTASVIYIDGVQSATAAVATQASAVTAVYIGQYGGGEFFNGDIDDVRIYNRVLSAADVAQLYTYTGKNGLFTLLSN